MATSKTTARKSPAKKAAKKTATAKAPARKTATKRAASQRPARVATKEVRARRAVSSQVDSAMDVGKQLLSAGLSKAQVYATEGKKSLAKAGKVAKSYGDVAAREIRKNPKVAAAVAAGVISVGSALLVKKIQKGNGASAANLADRAQRATSALATKATEVTHQLAEKLKDMSAKH